MSVGCMQCTRAGYKPNAFPNSVFAQTLLLLMLTSIVYFSEFLLYLLSLWATVCFMSFALYRRHGVVLRKPAWDSIPGGARSRRADFESARSRTVWHPNASYSRWQGTTPSPLPPTSPLRTPLRTPVPIPEQFLTPIRLRI
jgi:hypothetical protein